MAFFALIIVLLFYFLCKGVKSSIAQKYYCVFVSIGLILISGLRNPAVGEHSDTDNYLHSFDLSASISWKTIFSEFFPTYFSPSFEGNLWKDPGFTVFEKIISVFTSSHQIYLVIIAILFIVPLSRFIYRNVKDVRSALFAYSYYVSFKKYNILKKILNYYIL